jgi:hypothetical protein
MKNLILTSVFLLLVSGSVFSQNGRKTKNQIMRDSLWKSLHEFCITTEKFLNKYTVSQKDVNDFLDYVYLHMEDSVQSSDSYIPFMVKKKDALNFLTEQTKDMVNKNCDFSFVSWGGWDGKNSYTGFRFDIKHDGYKDQFLVIVGLKNEITSIFSVKSKL